MYYTTFVFRYTNRFLPDRFFNLSAAPQISSKYLQSEKQNHKKKKKTIFKKVIIKVEVIILSFYY